MPEMTSTKLTLALTRTERDWIRHAAKLRHLSVDEYVRRAINDSLCREGVDAVLLRDRGNELVRQ